MRRRRADGLAGRLKPWSWPFPEPSYADPTQWFQTTGKLEAHRQRLKRHHLPEHCPPYPLHAEEWLRITVPRYQTTIKVGWSELAMHTGQAGARILRVALSENERYAEVCTDRGYVHGLPSELIDVSDRERIFATWRLFQEHRPGRLGPAARLRHRSLFTGLPRR